MEIRRVLIEDLPKSLLIKEQVSKILKMLERKQKRNKEKVEMKVINKDRVDSIVDWRMNFSQKKKI